MRSFKKYLITLLSGAVVAFLIALSKEIFSQTSPLNVFSILGDSFFVVGVIITGIGALIFVTNEGTFDMIVYGLQSFWELFKRNNIRKYETFYDYRVSRQAKRLPCLFALLCGVGYILLAAIMYLLYRQYL